MKHLRLVIGLAAALLVGLLTVALPATASARDAAAPWNLTAVADACRATSQNGGPGFVEITSVLQDANRTVSIDVPCVVQLTGAAAVNLSNVTLRTKTLNIHDRSGGPGRSLVSLANSRVLSSDGVLVELNDATDVVNLARTTVDAPSGIVVSAAERRTGTNQGGVVTTAGSALRSSAPDGSGVQVTAAETGGVVSMAQTTINTPEFVTVLAGKCSASLGARVLDCSAATLARHLG